MTRDQTNANFRMSERYGMHPDDGQFPGRLIVVEGIDGSGKSTQIDLLGKWLGSQNLVTVFTEWNSSPIVRSTTKLGKDAHLLTPMSFSLIHAADFANRVHTQILPALKAGAIVLADRYVFTAFARDAARGVNRDWLRRVYSFAIRPTLALYFKVTLDESIHRIRIGREEIGYYESGQDMGLAGNRQDSFRMFQSRLLDEYASLTEEFGLVTIDALQSIAVQQRQVRQHVEPLLEDTMTIHGQSLPQALGSVGLTGRYINAPGSRKLPDHVLASDG